MLRSGEPFQSALRIQMQSEKPDAASSWLPADPFITSTQRALGTVQAMTPMKGAQARHTTAIFQVWSRATLHTGLRGCGARGLQVMGERGGGRGDWWGGWTGRGART